MIKTLKNARFMPLLGSHIFESLNDNLIRNIFVFLTAYHITGGSLYWLIVAFCLYGGAFLIMAAFSGPFADKFGRTFVIRRLKLFENNPFLPIRYQLNSYRSTRQKFL